jgi:hypothetical protein
VTERPSIGAVNPALTAMSNAIRVGEHLTDRLAQLGTLDPPPATPPADFSRGTCVLGGDLPGLSARFAGQVEADHGIVLRGREAARFVRTFAGKVEVDHGNDPEGSQQRN